MNKLYIWIASTLSDSFVGSLAAKKKREGNETGSSAPGVHLGSEGMSIAAQCDR